MRECSGASREETSRKTQKRKKTRRRAFFGFWLTKARQSQSFRQRFRRRFRAFRKPQKTNHVVCFRAIARRFRDGFKDVFFAYTVKRYRSNTGVPVEFAFFERKDGNVRKTRTRFALDFVRATYARHPTRRVDTRMLTRRKPQQRNRMLHHARVRENALMTPVLSTRNVSLTLILTSKRSNA